jgi:meso-butanediol dehydrogenase / (S,S)-butanediol dehydrogenase / diacetyl reductase
VRRVALVTGATSGIGRACAALFAHRGWGVVAVARHETELERLAARLGDSCLTAAGDVAEPATSNAAVRAALERFGRLDAAVANAGITLARPIDDTSAAELDRLIGVNVRGPFHLAQAAHEALRRSGGALVVMASNKGLVGQRGSPAYVATKGAAVQLARALALDWAAEGIRVNAVCPGLVDTPMLRSFASAQADPEQAWAQLLSEQPLGRLARPEECAEAVLWLASPASSFVTGVALPVDGGFTAQ